MFGKKIIKGSLYSTQDGECIDIKYVPDPVFSDKMLGEGVAIIPKEKTVVSPTDGTVEQVFDTYHAYSIRSKDGLEILVHIGLNTVELNGEGFLPKVKSGDRVSVGDALCEVDLEYIKGKGYELFTPIVITNTDEIKNLEICTGDAFAGKTAVMEYTKAK